MKKYLGVYLVVPGSLGVPQPAWPQSWSVAQSKYKKSSFRCRIDSWSADVFHRPFLVGAQSTASLFAEKPRGRINLRGIYSSRKIIRHNHHHRHHHRHLRGNSLAEKKVFAGLFFAGFAIITIIVISIITILSAIFAGRASRKERSSPESLIGGYHLHHHHHNHLHGQSLAEGKVTKQNLHGSNKLHGK